MTAKPHIRLRKDGTERTRLTREFTITRADRADADDDARTIRASLSDTSPVPRFYGDEVLRHDAAAVDLSRAAHGLPLLFNHDRDKPLGVVRDLRVRDGRLEGELQFARSALADDVWPQVRDGFLHNMSIGYVVDTFIEDADGNREITRWRLFEGSVVTVPASHDVGIGRGDDSPPAEPRAAAADSTTREHDTMTDTVVPYEHVRREARASGRVEGQNIERERISGIRELFACPRYDAPEYRALCEDLISEGASVEAAGRRLLAAIGDGSMPVLDARRDEDGRGRSAFVAAGADELDKFREAGAEVLAVRGGLERDQQVVRNVRSNELYGCDLVDLAREYLRRGGVRAAGLSKMDAVGLAFTRAITPGHGTSDFANLLSSTSEKAMLVGWDEADETWSTWCKIGRLPDFKSADRVGLSGFGDLDEVPENGEIPFGTMDDLKESIQLATYAKRFSISRQAIINDDLNAFIEVPRKMGRAAARKVGDLAYGRLTANPTLAQDATALFHADHNNLVAPGSGAAPSVTTLNAGFTAMANQTAPSPDGGTTAGHRINVRPRYLIVPVALEVTATTLVASTYDPAGTAGTLTPNPFAGRLTVVSDARLDANDPLQWYLAASPMQVDTVEVAFLDGEQRPFLDMMDGWSVDGVEHKVRMDAGASALDFRGLYENDGN